MGFPACSVPGPKRDPVGILRRGVCPNHPIPRGAGNRCLRCWRRAASPSRATSSPRWPCPGSSCKLRAAPPKTGITGFVAILPVVLSSLLGGAVVDCLGYKCAGIGADMASAGIVALIPLLYAADMLAFPVLLGLVFLGALLDASGSTARDALTPERAARNQRPKTIGEPGSANASLSARCIMPASLPDPPVPRSTGSFLHHAVTGDRSTSHPGVRQRWSGA